MARKLSRRSLAMYVASQLVLENSNATIIKQLAAYLVESRRTKELELIVRDVNFYLSEVGIVNATVTSAFDLTTETKKAIEQFIKKERNSSQVSIDTLIDPSVIGGVKISLSGYELDNTITHKLNVLKTRYKKA